MSESDKPCMCIFVHASMHMYMCLRMWLHIHMHIHMSTLPHRELQKGLAPREEGHAIISRQLLSTWPQPRHEGAQY